MDVLRVLAAHDLHVRSKTLNLVLELLSSQNVQEVVSFLQKEVSKTHRLIRYHAIRNDTALLT